MRIVNCTGSFNPETLVEDRDIYPEKDSNDCLTVYMKHDFYVTLSAEDIRKITEAWAGPSYAEMQGWEDPT